MGKPAILQMPDGWYFLPDDDLVDKMPLDTTAYDMLTEDLFARKNRLTQMLAQAVSFGRAQIKREYRRAGTEPIEGYGDGW